MPLPTAEEVRQYQSSLEVQRTKELRTKCESVLEVIAEKINFVKLNSKSTFVEFKWNPGDRPFGVSLYHWDGGEGKGDKITEAGEYVKRVLEKAGYTVSMSSDHIRISWEVKPTGLR